MKKKDTKMYFKRFATIAFAASLVIAAGAVTRSGFLKATDETADAQAPAPSQEAPAAEEPSAEEEVVAETSAPVATEAPAPETTAETSAPETSAPVEETQAPETAAPETTAPETAAPETTAPETASSETTAPETAAETNASSTEAAKDSADEVVEEEVKTVSYTVALTAAEGGKAGYKLGDTEYKAENNENDPVKATVQEGTEITIKVEADDTHRIAQVIGAEFVTGDAKTAEYKVTVKSATEIKVSFSEIPEEETKEETKKSVNISCDMEGTEQAAGTVVTLKAELKGFDDIDYTLQWEYSDDGGANWKTTDGTELTYQYVLDETTQYYNWRVVVNTEE